MKVSGRNCRCFKSHTNQLLCQWRSVAETAHLKTQPEKLLCLSKLVAETTDVWKPTLISYFASESQWHKLQMFENPHWTVTLPAKVSGRNCRCLKTHPEQLLCQWKKQGLDGIQRGDDGNTSESSEEIDEWLCLCSSFWIFFFFCLLSTLVFLLLIRQDLGFGNFDLRVLSTWRALVITTRTNFLTEMFD